MVPKFRILVVFCIRKPDCKRFEREIRSSTQLIHLFFFVNQNMDPDINNNQSDFGAEERSERYLMGMTWWFLVQRKTISVPLIHGERTWCGRQHSICGAIFICGSWSQVLSSANFQRKSAVDWVLLIKYMNNCICFVLWMTRILGHLWARVKG